MGLNWVIPFLFFLTIVSIALFNSTGIAMTKYASAAQRSTIDTSRTLTIWIMSLLLKLEPWEPWEIPGFILLAAGTLLYNEIIVFPYFGYNEYTKEALAKKKAAGDRTSGRLTESQDYVATSPHAVYDSKRNLRNLQNKIDEKMGKGVLDDDEFDIN